MSCVYWKDSMASTRRGRNPLHAHARSGCSSLCVHIYPPPSHDSNKHLANHYTFYHSNLAIVSSPSLLSLPYPHLSSQLINTPANPLRLLHNHQRKLQHHKPRSPALPTVPRPSLLRLRLRCNPTLDKAFLGQRTNPLPDNNDDDKHARNAGNPRTCALTRQRRQHQRAHMSRARRAHHVASTALAALRR